MSNVQEQNQVIARRPAAMSVKTLLIITAILDGLYAVNLLLMPQTFLEMHGLSIDAATIFTTRLLSPAVISDTLLALLGLSLVHNQGALRAIAFKFFVSWGLGGLVILLGKLTIESMSAVAWVDVGFAAIFTAMWVSFFAKPTVA